MPDDRSRGSDLCTKCGLCCTGILHNAAALDPDEVVKATELGLSVIDGEKPVFALPCPKLVDRCCTIYGSRPRACGRYRCQILQDLEAGDTSFELAIAKVGTARKLVEQVRSVMPPGMTLPQVRVLTVQPPPAEIDTMAPDERERVMRLKLAATALTLYMDRHFRNSRDGHTLVLNSLDDATGIEAG